MALNDLVRPKASCAAEMIEKTITGLVRLDEKLGLVLFTPEATPLPNRQKVLVYLVALQAWRFIGSGFPSGAGRDDI